MSATRVSIFTICTHPDRASGVDKIEQCSIFIDRRTYKLPFDIASPNPTEAMLRNNCYGIETDATNAVLEALRTMNWSWFCRGGVRGEFNLNKHLLGVALRARGFKIITPDKPPIFKPTPLFDV